MTIYGFVIDIIPTQTTWNIQKINIQFLTKQKEGFT